jgi:ATP-dependent DNA helicase RecQ
VAVEGKGAVARKRAALLHVLADEEARPAIVYCGTRKDTEEVAALIAAQGILAVTYHAGMNPERRRANQEAFMAGRAEVVVATNAFGMGVDKADVRTVAHWALPTSLEAYYQEAGRGGRDGLPARALLLAGRMDLGRLIRFNTERQTSVQDVRAYVGALRRRAQDEVVTIAPVWAADYADQPAAGAGDPTAGGGIAPAAGADPSAPSASPTQAAAALDRPSALGERERVLLSIAERAGAVELEPGARGALRVTLTGRGSPRMAYAAIKAAKDRGWESYRSIERFIANGERCRRRQILDHFGDDEPTAPSGRCCDVCEPDSALAEAIARALNSHAATGRRRATAGRGGAGSAGGHGAPGGRGAGGGGARMGGGGVRAEASAGSDPLPPVDEAAFEKLRSWRYERAEGKPAYTVAANAALEGILRERPRTLEALLGVHGIGPTFCERHGESLLEALGEL